MTNVNRKSTAFIRTYSLLSNALFSLLTSSPFEKITLTQICETAMIPRSTFYRYFEDKYDLLDCCFAQLFQQENIVFDIALLKDEKKAEEYFISLFRFLDKHKALYKKLIVANRKSAFLDSLQNYLETEISRSLLLEFKDTASLLLPAGMYTQIIASFIISVGKYFLESNELPDPEVLSSRLAICIKNGHLQIS